jgi:hypothetical protein
MRLCLTRLSDHANRLIQVGEAKPGAKSFVEKLIRISLNRKSVDPAFFTAANNTPYAVVSKPEMRSLAPNDLPWHSNALMVERPRKGHFRTPLCEQYYFQGSSVV